ncbi:MAG: hypothetical protein Q9166_005622 [cf. Caloplaca sp. 2 TL-2023]
MPLSPCAKVQENSLRLPLTPPDFQDGLDKEDDDDLIELAAHVIGSARDALANLHDLYRSNCTAQRCLRQAVHIISKSWRQGGRVIVSGVGKSGKIGQKFVATLNSFQIRSAFLNPTDALHGDLGMIGQNDAVVILTHSGKTAELLSMLRYLPADLPLIAVTSYADPSSCPLFTGRPSGNCVLLPAPIPCSEMDVFGAPTSSTTTALSLTDALALALARRLHPDPSTVFHHHHPGGAIGASAGPTGPQLMGSIAISVEDVPIVVSRQAQANPTILDAILTAASSASGWVRTSSETIIPPRQIQRMGRRGNLNQPLGRLEDGIIIEKGDWISIPAATSIQEAQEWVLHMRQTSRGRTFLKRGTVLGIVDGQRCVSGVVEMEEIIDDDQVQE